MDALELEAQAAFSDGLNTGFYINSYTTKQCPTMEGVLEEMRRGLERLQLQALRPLDRDEEGVADDLLVPPLRAGPEGDTGDWHTEAFDVREVRPF